jgi:hypothetical protein
MTLASAATRRPGGGNAPAERAPTSGPQGETGATSGATSGRERLGSPRFESAPISGQVFDIRKLAGIGAVDLLT